MFERDAACQGALAHFVGLSFTAPNLWFARTYCEGGSNCYHDFCNARLRFDGYTCGAKLTGDPPNRPRPRTETHRGVEFKMIGATIQLRRLADGASRRIRPTRDGVVDAELERAGLFYAYNRPSWRFPGRVVFLPFEDFFP